MKFLLLCVTLAALCVLGTVGQRIPNPPGNNVRFEPVSAVNFWSPYVQNVIRAEGFNLFNASRLSALVHVAMHDIEWSFRPDLGFSPYIPHASPLGHNPPLCHESSVAAATTNILVEYAPRHQLKLLAVNRFYYQFIRRSSPFTVPRIDRPGGSQYGAQVAQDLIDARLFDGYDAPSTFVLDPNPPLGDFTCNCVPTGSTWGQVTPWVVNASSYLPPGDIGYNDNTNYPVDFQEIIGKGVFASSRGRLTDSLPIRTGIETFVATFYSNDQYTSTAIGQALDTVQGILRRLRNVFSPQQQARLLALTSLALADATIVSYLNKYTFLDWSPETGIASANLDQYPDTVSTGSWEPLGESPTAPSFISDHGAIAGALRAVLLFYFGSDTYTFTGRSETLPSVEVTYDSFFDYASDFGSSRIYLGVDWRYSTTGGLNIGNLVGQAVTEQALI